MVTLILVVYIKSANSRATALMHFFGIIPSAPSLAALEVKPIPGVLLAPPLRTV